MSDVLPNALKTAIEAFEGLPGVGQRTAERYAYYLLRSNPQKASLLSSSLAKLHDSVKLCKITFALVDSNTDVSPLYTNPARNKQIVAVVEDPFDIVALERTGLFKGTYHVLGGLISPIDGVGPEQLHIEELISRIKKDKVSELILATNASVEGESTALYIKQQLEGHKILISRLAQGLPIGLDLEFADQITLGRALEGRREV